MTRKYRRVCGSRCASAKSSKCKCICNGVNHSRLRYTAERKQETEPSDLQNSVDVHEEKTNFHFSF